VIPLECGREAAAFKSHHESKFLNPTALMEEKAAASRPHSKKLCHRYDNEMNLVGVSG
jgi:hypothetical protein